MISDTALNLDGTLNFYSRLQYAIQQQDAAEFYSPLLEKTQYAYESWVVQEIHRRISQEPSTQAAFDQWLTQQGYTTDNTKDLWSIDSFLQSVIWSSTANRYLTIPEYSAAELAQGREMDQYLNIMQTGYYPTDLWMNQIYPLFKDYWSQVVTYDQQQSPTLDATPVSGTNAEQDALWRWIDARNEDLVFQDGRWQLKE